MKSRPNKNSFPVSSQPEAVSEAQRLIDHWSFAGYAQKGSYDHNSQPLDGQSLLWLTRTFRGPGNFLLSDQVMGDQEVEPRHGTVVVVESPNKTNVIVFQQVEKSLTATEYAIEYLDGGAAMVGAGQQSVVPKSWAANIAIGPDSVAKVITLDDMMPAESVDTADTRLSLDDAQRHEFGLAYEALKTIRADEAVQHRTE